MLAYPYNVNRGVKKSCSTLDTNSILGQNLRPISLDHNSSTFSQNRTTFSGPYTTNSLSSCDPQAQQNYLNEYRLKRLGFDFQQDISLAFTIVSKSSGVRHAFYETATESKDSRTFSRPFVYTYCWNKIKNLLISTCLHEVLWHSITFALKYVSLSLIFSGTHKFVWNYINFFLYSPSAFCSHKPRWSLRLCPN